MIVVNAIIESTESDILAMKDAIQEMETQSRKESGCNDYTFSVEVSNPNVIRVTEQWNDMTALNAHFAEPHMAVFQAAMAANPPISVSAKFYEATEVPGPGQ